MINLILCDIDPYLVRCWRNEFRGCPDADVECGDLTEIDAGAYVSPANSFGIMDGGIDAVLSRRFPQVERRLQSVIGQMGGMLPVGEALVVDTGDPDVPYMIAAPTMEVPSYVGATNNAYRAMLALLIAVDRFNAANNDVIETVAIPGLCTGVGAMSPETAAFQMAQAYREWVRAGR